MGAYEDNLRHVAEPQTPSERDQADKITLEDFEALWFTTQLREHAHYRATDPHSGIAVAYASYIDKKVREESSKFVSLYVHTNEALETIVDAADNADDSAIRARIIQKTVSI